MSGEGAGDLPAYRSLARVLADRIGGGELASGSRVPSERELASEFGVSRMTARAALNSLSGRGLIERRDRSGNYVSSPKVRLNLSTVAGLSARLVREGISPGARVVEARTCPANEFGAEVRAALDVLGDEPVHAVIRTRTGNGEPLALEESYFPAHRCPGLLHNSSDLTGSIYDLLRDAYGLEPDCLYQEVELTQLDPVVAGKLGVRPDAPVLLVTRIARDAEGRPIEYARDLYRGDRLLFIAETEKVAGGRKEGDLHDRTVTRVGSAETGGPARGEYMTLDTEDGALRRAVASMPGWREADRIDATYISGGITNRNYCVRVDGEPYFVRLAGEETEALGIDRANERAAVEAASSVRIGPGVVAFLPEQGCLVTEWIDGSPVPPDELRKPETLERLVRSIRAYHALPEIPGTFSPFRVVELYRESAQRRGVEVPEVYWWLLERARDVEAALETEPVPPRPCHNDLLNANFLLYRDEMKIVDWEYAGMGDVYFDLGNLSVNNDFDDETDRELLGLYFGEVTPPRLARLKLMRLMSDFREAMWGVMQQALSSLDFDYAEYARKHFDRCCEHAEDERHAGWLQTAASRT